MQRRAAALTLNHFLDTQALQLMNASSRGLLVIGQLSEPEDIQAAVRLATSLRWPTIIDVLSGLKVGNKARSMMDNLILYVDHILLARSAWELLMPDVVVQVGGRLTSKRLIQFLVSKRFRSHGAVFPDPALLFSM